MRRRQGPIYARQRGGSIVTSDRICSVPSTLVAEGSGLSTAQRPEVRPRLRLYLIGMLTRSRSPDGGSTDERHPPYRPLSGYAEEPLRRFASELWALWHGIKWAS